MSDAESFELFKWTCTAIPIVIGVYAWITVSWMHRREAYYWSMATTYAVPLLAIVSGMLVLWGIVYQMQVLYIWGVVLYAGLMFWATRYNFIRTRSVVLTFMLLILQHFGVLILLWAFMRFGPQPPPPRPINY